MRFDKYVEPWRKYGDLKISVYAGERDKKTSEIS